MVPVHWGTKGCLLANGPIWTGCSDLALISAHILTENMSESNRESRRGDLGERNATNSWVLGALTAEDSTGVGGEVHTPEVCRATKGKNPVQEVQTSAIKSVAWLEGQGDGRAEHRRGRWERLSAPELQGYYPWNSVGDLR